MTNQDHRPACNCYDCNKQKEAYNCLKQFYLSLHNTTTKPAIDTPVLNEKAYGTHTTANPSAINLDPYRLETLALEAISRFFTNTHQRLLGNMTLDAVVDNCFNLPEVVAYIDATSSRDSKAKLVSTVGWTPMAKKYIKERISYEIRKFINSGK